MTNRKPMKQTEASKRFASLVISIEVKVKLHRIANPITSKAIEAEYCISGVQVREIIRLLRRQGVPIASTGGQEEGYYYAVTYDQPEPTLQDLKSREDSLRVTRLAMMKKFDMHEGLFA